ncbi:Uncharacterised protein [uncultured archaeon]|nr:Uncharacterised protein [uncultured archaeon]
MKLILKGIIFAMIMLLAVGAFAAVPDVSQFTYTPSPAVPGSTIIVTLQLENKNESTLKGVSVQLENAYPFTVKPTDTQPNPISVGDLAGHGKAQVQFTVYVDPSAENKTYTLPVTLKTTEDTTGTKTSYEINISGKEPLVKVVSVVENNLLPGEEKTIVLEVQNVGTSPAYDVLVEMQEDRTVTATGSVVERDIVPLGAATAYLPQINPGEKQTAELKVSVSSTATVKTYTQPIKVSYRNSSGTRTTDTSYIGLSVFGNVELDATLKEIIGSILPGQKADITLELFNKGLGKAEFVLVELSADNATIQSPKQFIGSLGPNDVDTVKTSIIFNTAGDHIITATINYQDADATTKKSVVEVPVKAQLAGETGTNPLFIIIVLVVIGFLVWNFFLRKKGKK